MFPITIANFVNVKNIPWLDYIVQGLSPDRLLYNVLYVLFIVFFCYFYTAVQFNPIDVADNMKRQGGFIPGIRPGKNTAEYIDRVLTRITFSGAIYVAFVCVLPNLLIYKANVPFYFGGTGLLIVVGVAMDTANQIESHMLSRHYEGFMKKGLGRVR
jgi:preprotein translocase subunit SecY